MNNTIQKIDSEMQNLFKCRPKYYKLRTAQVGALPGFTQTARVQENWPPMHLPGRSRHCAGALHIILWNIKQPQIISYCTFLKNKFKKFWLSCS